MKNNATETKPTCTWTNYKGEWMIRSNVKLGADNTINGKWEEIGGHRLSIPGEVEVTNKAGVSKLVRVGEYEKCFKNPDGTESHIYSIKNL